MPPQGWVIVGGIGSNAVAAALGLPTISQWARRHKALSVGIWVAGTCWIIPHWLHD